MYKQFSGMESFLLCPVKRRSIHRHTATVWNTNCDVIDLVVNFQAMRSHCLRLDVKSPPIPMTSLTPPVFGTPILECSSETKFYNSTT
ncbi:unnamed protein product [Danaus chrysippus]|uniref:(African queen) hypothetical protein n=1 Tax=Danaus chrysippus TaxID=151541 RepID=A0A8J2VYW1_9NEOP|nr:unnamed protein product [Danaus chrysippus]